jgi:hypothetical protein
MMPAADIKVLVPPPNGVVERVVGRSQFSLSPADTISGYTTRKPPRNPCCAPSNNPSNSLIPSEASSFRVRKRARSDSDVTIGPSSAPISTLSDSVRSAMVTP